MLGAVQNVITHDNFGEDRSRGFSVARGRILVDWLIDWLISSQGQAKAMCFQEQDKSPPNIAIELRKLNIYCNDISLLVIIKI